MPDIKETFLALEPILNDLRKLHREASEMREAVTFIEETWNDSFKEALSNAYTAMDNLMAEIEDIMDSFRMIANLEE